MRDERHFDRSRKAVRDAQARRANVREAGASRARRKRRHAESIDGTVDVEQSEHAGLSNERATAVSRRPGGEGQGGAEGSA
jgi:hypothetical protein